MVKSTQDLSMPPNIKIEGSEWNAGFFYSKTLQELEEFANIIKMKIELREGTPQTIINWFELYFSLLRIVYRTLRPTFKDKIREDIDSEIKEIRKNMRMFVSTNSGMVERKSLQIPIGLEDRMEVLQNRLSDQRFKFNLTTPLKTVDTDELGVAGWDV